MKNIEHGDQDLSTWEAWEEIHQPFELGWWKAAIAGGHSSDPGFSEHWAPVIEFIAPVGHVIDIGCGPRPPFRRSSVIEPLAIQYQEFVPPDWWRDINVYPVPAECKISELVDQGDTVICWNCIDHAIGWRDILDNMRSYGRPGAKFAIATDFYEPFTGHPGFPRQEFEREIEKRFIVEHKQEPFGRQLALLLSAR